MQDEGQNEDLITPGELQAELNSLRNLRRRSLSSPSEGALDPDLLSSTSTSAPSASATGPISNLAYPLDQASTTAATEQLDGLPDDLSSDSDTALPLSDLFWLPAHLHPEIAPQKFKQFLREQTKPENLQRRTSGKSGAGLDRKKSMLSRQYDPSSSESESDHDSGIGSTSGSMKKKRGGLEGLTISDLQRLESLAVQAAQETGQDEEGQLAMTNLLRRSLSLDQAGARDAESADSPLIVPAPGSILRRSARTKIRKPSLLGDGGGHRFAASRRNKMSVTPPAGEDAPLPPTTPEREAPEAFPDVSSPVSPSTSPTKAAARLSAGYHRPTSASFTDSIVVPVSAPPDATPSATRPSPRHQRSKSGDSFLDSQQPPSTSEFGTLTSEPESASHETHPGRRHTSPPRETSDLPPVHLRRHSEEQQRPVPSFTPVQQPASTVSEPSLPLSSPSSATLTTPASLMPPAASPPTSKEKEKKSTWARFGLSRTGSSTSVHTEDNSIPTTPVDEEVPTPAEKKKGKRAKKSLGGAGSESTDEAMPKKEKEKEKDKDSSSFFGLFKKKPANDQDPTGGSTTPPTSNLSPTASGMMGKNGKYTNFYRLPIHVERAVYRLSHIKLANPRRPLYEQVLISNLMFWYLSVINKPQHPPQQQRAPVPPPQPVQVPTAEGSSGPANPDADQITSSHAAPVDITPAEDANDDQPLMKREPESTSIPSARLVGSNTSRPDRSASLTPSPNAPLINVKRTTTRNDGFEVMHRQPKESSSRRVVSESAAPPSTRTAKSRPKETESSWLSSAEASRPAQAPAPDTSHLDAPIDIPVHTRSSSTPSLSPPKSDSPGVTDSPSRSKSPSRPGMGSKKSSSAGMDSGSTKTAVHS